MNILFAAVFALLLFIPEVSHAQPGVVRVLTWSYDDTSSKVFEVQLGGTWSISYDDTYFTATPTSGTGTMTLTIHPNGVNESTQMRETDIIVTSTYYNGSFTMTQMGAPEPEPRPGNWVQRTTFTSSDGATSFDDLTYYDGLGYPLQTVAGKAGGTSSAPNLVTPIVYDNMRRDDATTYLPYASAEGLDSLVSGAVSKQAQFYRSLYGGEDRPYAEKVYETSPIGRPLSAAREGNEWADHPVTMDYAVNTAADSVMKFSYSHSQQKVHRDDHPYGQGTLIKTTSTNEDGQRTVVFTDAWGKTICSRLFPDDSTVIETSYIYDLKDNLVCVIQPKGMDCLKADTSIDEITLDGAFARSNCFTYLRDGLGRVKRSVVPGGAVTEYAYDDRNRLRLMSTERMVDGDNARRYVVMNYDNYDRLVMRGYIKCTGQVAEQVRNSLDVTAIPNSTMLRVLYNTSYYPFTDGAQSVPGLPFQADEVATTPLLSTTGHRGLLMSETIADVNGITNTYSAAGVTRSRAYYYDAKGRVIQIRESDSDGHAATYSTSYDFAGNVTATLEKHTSPGNVTHILKTDYTRDARGRVTSCSRTFDGNSLPDVIYGYDALGRLSGKEGGGALEETYDYDIHGWQTAMNAKVNSTEVFSQMLNYESPSGQGASPRWSGAISGSLSKHYGTSNYSGENYSYDGAGRFTGMTRYSPPVPGQMITVVQERVERNVEYDANGNITGLERLMGIRDSHDLAMQYSGNRLMSVTDGNSAPMLYDYDADGNLASDGHTGFEFSYNILNLPMSAEDGADGRTMTYTYLSDGTKLKAVSDGGAGLTYRGSFVYGLSSGGGCTLESVATDEGRLVMDGTAVKDEWHVRDHVGNVRSVVWLNAPAGTSVSASILEQNDYLPFGTRLPGSRTDQSNRYRLGGKEEQDIAGMDLSLLDFGARYYDAYVGRWNAIDPLAHKYFGMSPYNYCGNDPVNFFDPDGRFIVTRDPENQQALFYNVEKQCFVDSNGNDYSGDNEYILNLTTQLTSLCNGESGMELVSSLVDSEKGVEITQGQKNVEGEWLKSTLADNVVSGIQYSGKSGSSDGTPYTALGHELAHSLDRINGTLDNSKWFVADNKIIPVAEIYATHVENKLRAEHGIPLRRYYAYDTMGGGFGPSILDTNNRSLYYTFDGTHNPNYKVIRPREQRYKY